jgi:MurNAc alpha-1-phosphate uridylyltransferase
MRAMILAAGLGKRLKPLTNTIPKPMVLVGGKPLLQWHIERLVRANVKEIVINISWLGDQIEKYFGSGSDFGANILWSREHSPLDTGGGIYNALKLLGEEPFTVINADVWTQFPFETLTDYILPPQILAHLLLVKNPAHNKNGDFALKNDIIGYEKPRHTFSGISILSPKIFKIIDISSNVFSLPSVLEPAILSGNVSGMLFSEDWHDVGTMTRLNVLNQSLIETNNHD